MPRLELVTNLYYPDQLGGAALFSDLASYFKENGWEVYVTTTFPYYPEWKISKEDSVRFRREDVVDGNKVTRLRIYVPQRPNGLKRALFELSFLISLLLNSIRRQKSAHILLTACPMLSQCCFLGVTNQKRSIPVMLMVQDFAIGAAVDLGILRGPFFSKLLSGFETWCFSRSDVLSSIAFPMVQKLQTRMRQNSRIPVAHIPNWIHSSLNGKIVKSIRNGSEIRKKNCIFYSGNIGIKQALEQIVQIFKDKEFSNWKLNINGDGVNCEKTIISADRCSHIKIGCVQSEDDYISRLLSCTAYLITQKVGSEGNSFPSKLLPALATGTPVLAVCDSGSPLAELVKKGNFGKVISMDREELRNTLACFERDSAMMKTFSENAFRESKKYSRQTVLGKYRKIFESLIDQESGLL